MTPPRRPPTGSLEEGYASLEVGARLGRYEVRGLLGTGGMGEVYRAWDEGLGREVAVKVLPRRPARDPDLLRRFEQEARAVGALNHPNVLAVYDVGTSGGTPFVISEILEGQTLGGRMAGSPLPLRKCLDYAIQIAQGLAAAHAKGIVHRDLKPENLFVTDDGRLKILDFGLAKLEHSEPQPQRLGEAPSPPPSTTPGTILGTVGYMAPEQVRGLPADHRSDIFAVGAVFYEMLFGRKAFKGDNPAETMYAILKHDPLELAASERVLAPGVERILRHCLEKSPEERFQSARDLAFQLEALPEASETAPPAAPLRPPARRLRVWLALLAVLLAAGLWGWRAWRGRQRAEPPRATALTTFPGAELYPSLSPDGNHVAFTWTGPRQDNPDIYVQLIGSGPPLRLTTDPRSDLNPVWSPDGRWIAFLRGESSGPFSQSDRELRLIPPLGGPERKLAEVRVREVAWPAPAYLAWCPESDCLVVTDSPGEGQPDSLFVVSLETGEKRRLTSPLPPVVADTSPAVSPDGRALAFRRTASWGSGEIHLLPLRRGMTADGEPKRRTSAALGANDPAWMPDGEDLLVSARGSLWRLSAAGEEPPERLPFVGEDGSSPVVSRPQAGRPARLVYARSFEDEGIWRIDTSAAGAPTALPPVAAITSTRSEVQPQFSPDGLRVAFASTRSGGWEIWLADPDGANAVQLTSMGAHYTGAPSWSPDGRQITFASSLEGQFELYGIPAAGGKPRRLTFHPAFDHAPSSSRDGTWTYFCSNRTGEYQVWKVPASGGNAVQVTPNGGCAAAEAADGAHLYYTQTPVAASSLWRLATSGGQPVKVLDGVVEWAFVVVERGIYHVDRPAAETRLQFFDFATGRSTTVARNLGNIRYVPTATPDGRTILFSRVDSSLDDLMLVDDFR